MVQSSFFIRDATGKAIPELYEELEETKMKTTITTNHISYKICRVAVVVESNTECQKLVVIMQQNIKPYKAEPNGNCAINELTVLLIFRESLLQCNFNKLPHVELWIRLGYCQ